MNKKITREMFLNDLQSLEICLKNLQSKLFENKFTEEKSDVALQESNDSISKESSTFAVGQGSDEGARPIVPGRP
ncbi:MAG: hypothetical protein LEGION0398_MBIBDBAK_00457 [Legionellaceae bacterium]